MSSGISHLLANNAAATARRHEDSAQAVIHNLRDVIWQPPPASELSDSEHVRAALGRIEHKLTADTCANGVTVLVLLGSLVVMVGYLVTDAVIRSQ